MNKAETQSIWSAPEHYRTSITNPQGIRDDKRVEWAEASSHRSVTTMLKVRQ